MNIGDKVRFLNAVGGGIVRKFKNKDLVIVEEEDGFETPVLIKECIVVSDNAMQVKNTSGKAIEKAAIALVMEKPKDEKYEITEITGGDRLNVYLAYLPIDIKSLGKTGYEAFLINESNYYLFFNYMSRQNNAWMSRYSELIEPNTRLFLEEFSKNQLPELEKICVQFLAFKKDKTYSLKNTYSVELRLDALKFYKLHSFRENDFFEEDALVYPIVTNDTAIKELLISASDLQEAMTQKSHVDKPKQNLIPVKKNKIPEIIEVDLHINQLLDTTAGLSPADILQVQLDKFNRVMTENKNRKGQKIVFIHGKGEGVLRSSILSELKLKYKHCPVQDASFREYGFGASMVTVK
ncbi:MAG: DUF2027 domain-containing protein [Dysgonamonadaceae bacterium]|jgi:hypothetical protein|nr:DUF2027 domain-containing protein [Dysgonamonadaceae bacterium]